MKITILTLFPEMFRDFLSTSIVNKAQLLNKVTFEIINIRDYADNKYKRIDTPPVGGGPGMIMQVAPLVDALKAAGAGHKVLLSPRGTIFNQGKAVSFSLKEHLVLICGHYEGVDERLKYYIDEEISLGDYILTGGEIGAMAISDAVVRLIDGVINADSLYDESFNRHLLEYPQYTEPFDYNGYKVPQILYSGNHDAIRKWRLKQSLLLTYNKRPDLYKLHYKDKETMKLLEEALNDEIGDWEKEAIAKGHKYTKDKK
ncbi:MAG TPA: tRNA (guanosine(37)-N1)-methyltransferase TrmD [Bacilli bacterium]|nr:tRNA (guanosine(37)-N1)-methyltransferase TrmD [Bacilli bacterium]